MSLIHGTILFDNDKISNDLLNSFGYLPEEGSLLPEATVLELCEHYGALKLISSEDVYSRLKYWLKEFKIEEYLDMKVKSLSKGNRQKIQFIVSLLNDPKFLILDEPFSGLDPVSVEELEKAILKLKSQGKTIIFSSHIMSHVENICDDVLLIDHGKALIYGNLLEILKEYKINGNPVLSFNDVFIDKVGEANE